MEGVFLLMSVAGATYATLRCCYVLHAHIPCAVGCTGSRAGRLVHGGSSSNGSAACLYYCGSLRLSIGY
jgi:hypothetical protein